MSKFGFGLFISVLAALVVFFYSVNVFYYQKGKDYLELKISEARFGDVSGTCLVRAVATKEKLDKDKVYSKILVFFCKKPTGESMGHAVLIYSSEKYLLMFDNDNSEVIGKLIDVNFFSEPKDIISKRYNYVVEARWLDE